MPVLYLTVLCQSFLVFMSTKQRKSYASCCKFARCIKQDKLPLCNVSMDFLLMWYLEKWSSSQTEKSASRNEWAENCALQRTTPSSLHKSPPAVHTITGGHLLLKDLAGSSITFTSTPLSQHKIADDTWSILQNTLFYCLWKHKSASPGWEK